METLEFKIKFNHELLKWENIPVELTAKLPVDYCKIQQFIDNTFLNSDIKEIRWNIAGSPQGHYYTPKNARIARGQ